MQTEKPWGQMIFGLAAILVSGLIILGSLSFTLLEGKPEIALLPATTNISLETALKITIVPGEPTFTPILPTSTPSIPPPVNCPPPDGWFSYVIQPDDTFASLADLLGQPVENVARGNCLPSGASLKVGTLLFLPYPASPTPTPCSPTVVNQSGAARTTRRTANPPLQCGRSAGWTTYVVRFGDTLYSISLRYYTTVPQLQRANCLNSTIIRAGRIIYVPNRATRTPYPTATPRPTLIPTTLSPTTLVPSLPPVTTVAPTVPVPTTVAPTTVVPTTPVSTTPPPPTTVAPTAPPPTTVVPTTPPTTIPPTQPPPTASAPPPTPTAPSTEP